jgi:acetyl esterase
MRDRLETAALMSTLRLPSPVLKRLVGGRRTSVDGLTLDLQTEVLLSAMRAANVPPPNLLPVSEGRELYRARAAGLGPRPRTMRETIDRTIPGPHGPIPVRIYVPRSFGGPAPVLVYYHGGGWVIGDLDTHDRPCRLLAAEADCILVSVDYRLAPEHKFPVPIDDAVAAYRWVTDHAEAFGGDPSRIAVGGDSAGGNLAAVVSQSARDSGGPVPRFQLLIYPVTDLRIRTRSYELFADGFFLTRDMMVWFRDHYLSGHAERVDPRVSPLLASDLRSLPATFLSIAGFDPLRDEGREYAGRLRDAGNRVELRCYDGLVHGYSSMSGGISAARVAAGEAASALRRAMTA